MANNRELSQFANTVGYNGGNVGINSASPSHRLEVAYSDDDDGFVINNIGRGGKFRFATSGSNGENFDVKRFDSANSTFRRYLLFGPDQFAVSTGSVTSTTERLRVTSVGRVGINSTSPATALDIQSTKNSDGLTVTKAGTRSVFLGHNGSGNEGILVLRENGTNKIQLYAESNQDSFINTGGNIGIGTDSPAYNLDLGESSSTIRLVSENDGTAIRIGAGAGNADVSLIRVDGNGGFNVHGESNDSSYGFSLKYMGSRNGNSNSLSIFSDNQTGTQFEALTILQDGSFGINETAPLGKLHVKTGDSGTTSVGASADELVIEGSGHAGMTILSGDNQQGIINFGETDDNNIGGITYNHGDNDLLFRTSNAERIRITSVGHLLYDTNKGGIYNFDKACSANASTNIFRVDNEHGAHCFTIYMTGSNSGNSVSKIYNVACKYGSNPTISSAADTGAYSSNNFTLTGSVSGKTHTFAISITGSAATIACTVVLGSMNTSATVTLL